MINKVDSTYRIQPISPIYPISDKQGDSPEHQDRQGKSNENQDPRKHNENTLRYNGGIDFLV